MGVTTTVHTPDHGAAAQVMAAMEKRPDEPRPAPGPAVRPGVIDVTPSLAAAMLRGNVDNRPLERRQVEKFKRLILGGNFRVTTDAIGISVNGRLLNGQHRLTAVVETGRTVPMLVAFGLDEAAFDAIDRHRARGQAFVLGGRPVDIATARMVWRLVNDDHGALVADQELADTLAWIRPMLERLHAIKHIGPNRGRGSAPVRTAVVARACIGHGKHAIAQFEALARLDYRAMSDSVISLYEQIEKGRAAAAGARSWDLLARAWNAFDPERSDLSRVMVRDIDTRLEEVAEALRAGKLAWERAA